MPDAMRQSQLQRCAGDDGVVDVTKFIAIHTLALWTSTTPRRVTIRYRGDLVDGPDPKYGLQQCDVDNKRASLG